MADLLLALVAPPMMRMNGRFGVDTSGQTGVIELAATVAKELAAGLQGKTLPGIPTGTGVPPEMRLGATNTAMARYKSAYWLAIGSQIANYRASKSTGPVVDYWKGVSSSLYRWAYTLQMAAGADATMNWVGPYRDPNEIAKIFNEAAHVAGAMPEITVQLTTLGRPAVTTAAQATAAATAKAEAATSDSWIPTGLPSLPGMPSLNPLDYVPDPRDYLPGAPTPEQGGEQSWSDWAASFWPDGDSSKRLVTIGAVTVVGAVSIAVLGGVLRDSLSARRSSEVVHG